MSILIDKSKVDSSTLLIIDSELNLTIIPPSKYNNNTKKIYIQAYRIVGNLVWIPYAYGVSKQFCPLQVFPKINEPIQFKGSLRSEQKIVRNEAIEILNKKGSVVLSTHVGFGKSILATYFAYKIQLKTLIVVNRLTLIDQWVQVFKDFIVNPKIQVIKSREIVDWSYDFFIINAINIPKIGYTPEIGLVIVDEVHLIMSKVLSQGMQYLTPRYIIGLSATPYRPDGLDKLIDLYFGEERVDRQLNRKHYFYKIKTDFTPVINKQKNNKIDWNDILQQQAENVSRNEMIIDILLKNNDYNFLVLCKRVEQIKYLEKRLLENQVDTQALYGDRQPIKDRESKVLIGTIQKVGTGFDAPYLNALLLAADVEEYFIQYLGRVFRKRYIVPVIFDLVDNCSILEKHYRTREATYKKHGGENKKYED